MSLLTEILSLENVRKYYEKTGLKPVSDETLEGKYACPIGAWYAATYDVDPMDYVIGIARTQLRRQGISMIDIVSFMTGFDNRPYNFYFTNIYENYEHGVYLRNQLGIE